MEYRRSNTILNNTTLVDPVFSGTSLTALNAAGPALMNAAAANNDPTLVPKKTAPGTGVGATVSDQLSLIASGVEVARLQTTQFLTAVHGSVSAPRIVTGKRA